jgi:hypothetical protein
MVARVIAGSVCSRASVLVLEHSDRRMAAGACCVASEGAVVAMLKAKN